MVAEETKKTVDSGKDFSEMASLDVDDDQDLADDNSKDGHESSSKRSERKRNRERQRRSELSGAFDDLAAVITQIDPERPPAFDDKKKRRKSASGSRGSDGEDASGITRLDLIGRAVQVMRKLHQENEERKRVIEQMRHPGNATGQGQRSDNALVIVPHLTPMTDDQPFPVARVAYPPGTQIGQMPQMAAQHPAQHPAQHQEYLARAQQQGYGSAQWGNFPVGHHMTRPVVHQGMHTWHQPQQQQQVSNYAAHLPSTNRPPHPLSEDPQPLDGQGFV